MRKISELLDFTDKKRRIGAVLAGAAALAAAALLLMPWYRSYMEEDHRETCYKLDLFVDSSFHEQAEEKADAAADEELVRKIVRDSFEVELDEAMSTSDLCREGGTVTFELAENPRRVHIFCTIHGEQYENLPVEAE